MKTFALTEKELKAAYLLTASCLSNMGGKRPADLEHDECTWVTIQDLMDRGYSQHEAAGIFSGLYAKGFIQGDYNAKQCETFIATEGWRYMETVWEAA